MLGQDSWEKDRRDRTAKNEKTVRMGKAGLDREDIAARTRKYGQNSWNLTTGTKAVTAHLRQEIWDMETGVTMGQDSLDMSAWIGRVDRSAWTGQGGQDMTARPGQVGQVSW
jgi:hypothetical protein